MSGTMTTRRCGNCGGEVGAAEVVCPHCDALLAAYESPTGSTSGTTAAVMPVDTVPPPTPATPIPTEPAATPPPASNSPVSDAIEATKAAADGLGSAPTAPPEPPPAAERLAEPVDFTDLPAQAAHGIPVPEQPQGPSPIAEALAETKAKVDAPVASAPTRPEPKPQQAQAARVPVAPVERPRPVRTAAPAPVAEPVIEPEPIAQEPTHGTQRGKSSGTPIWFVVIALFVFMRAAGSTAAFGTLLTFAAIGLMIWFIVRITNATGRKTTSMPWDPSSRRRRR